MNFEDAKFTRSVIWYDGPLLSVMEHKDKVYMCKWADVVGHMHTWLIFEVAPEILGLYFAKALTMRDVEERAPCVFIVDDDMSRASWVNYDDVPECWKAREGTSYYDECLEYNQPKDCE